MGSDSPQTCSFSGFPHCRALFATHRTQSEPKASCSPGEPLAGRQESPVSSFSLPAKVSGLDADALSCLPSACTSLRVSERKLKVSATQTWSKVTLYSWGWYDGHQASKVEERGEVKLCLLNKELLPAGTAVWKVAQTANSVWGDASANSSSAIPGNLRMIKALFKHRAKFWSQFYSTNPE